MSNLFQIGVSALQALQTAIATTSNNIANANTPGYAKESVDLTTAIPQAHGSTSVGTGVQVTAILRAYSQVAANQLNGSQSNLGQLASLQAYTNQVDNIVGTTAGGVSAALQSYYTAWSNVANAPTSIAARQALVSAAQGVASSFQSTSSQIQTLNTNINGAITADVQQINSIGASISKLNQQIVVGTAQAGGQPPNDLIDQRDQLLSNLSQLVGVTTNVDGTGALNVFVGNGQPLVLQGKRDEPDDRAESVQRVAARDFDGGERRQHHQRVHHLGRFGRFGRSAYAGGRPGAEPTRPDRDRREPVGECAAERGHGPQRQARRRSVLGRVAGRDRVRRQWRRHDRDRRHRECRRADRERLSIVLPRRRVQPHEREHGRGGRLHGRGHGRESDQRGRACRSCCRARRRTAISF